MKNEIRIDIEAEKQIENNSDLDLYEPILIPANSIVQIKLFVQINDEEES